MSDGEFRAPQYGKFHNQGHDDDGAGRRSCYTKKRYATEDYAIKVARRRERNGSDPLRVYPCYRCGGYHLTRNPE